MSSDFAQSGNFSSDEHKEAAEHKLAYVASNADSHTDILTVWAYTLTCMYVELTIVMLPYRDGLNVRAAQSDNAQVSIEMGQGGYDLDDEIEGLRTDVGRLKQVSPAPKHPAQGGDSAHRRLIPAATPGLLSHRADLSPDPYVV